MKIIKMNPPAGGQKPELKILKQAAKIIKQGGVVAMPFDTCYGLAADVTNKKAVTKVFQIKKRDLQKPISAVFKNIKMIKKYLKINKIQETELKKYLPGFYTIILPAKQKTKIFTKCKNTISVRIPNFPFTFTLSSMLNIPYTATSANISGRPEIWSGKKLIKVFKNQAQKPDLILDGGLIPKKPLSTIIDLSQKKPKITKR